MTTKLKKPLIFISVFANEFVNILYNVVGQAISYQGYVIDADERYVYIGDSMNKIDFAIQHEYIAHIELHSEDKLFKKVLKDMGEPEEGELQ